MAQHWTCPYCNRDCTIGEADRRLFGGKQLISKEYGWYYGYFEVIVCPSPACRKKSISAYIHAYDDQFDKARDQLYEWKLMPDSEAKPFPDYIPKTLLS